MYCPPSPGGFGQVPPRRRKRRRRFLGLKFKPLKFLGKVAKVAVPVAAGGLALKFVAPKAVRLARGLFRRRPGTVAPGVTAPIPEVTAAPSTAEAVMQTAATIAATQAAAQMLPPVPTTEPAPAAATGAAGGGAPPGVSPEVGAEPTGGEEPGIQRAGLGMEGVGKLLPFLGIGLALLTMGGGGGRGGRPRRRR